jgi:hypothetical protein
MAETTKKIPNAQKWTVERVNSHLDRIELDLELAYCFFLGWALKRQGLRKHVWSYWKQIFANNDDMIERMLLIESKFEAKILTAGMKNELPATMVERTLRIAYGWSNKERSKSLMYCDFK